jgi:hypothetical protein
MAASSARRKRPKACPVELAVAAVVEGNQNPLDQDMSAVSFERTSLDLPEIEHQEPCSRCGRPAAHRCIECGSPLCGDCLGHGEDED